MTTIKIGLGSRVQRTAAVIGITIAAALLVNLALWILGDLAGGDFITVDDGETNDAAPGGVIIMTVVPLLIGLATAAGLAFAWRPILPIATAIGGVAALATIGLTTSANFDTASTVSLSAMHVVIAAAIVGALEALRRNVFNG